MFHSNPTFYSVVIYLNSRVCPVSLQKHYRRGGIQHSWQRSVLYCIPCRRPRWRNWPSSWMPGALRQGQDRNRLIYRSPPTHFHAREIHILLRVSLNAIKTILCMLSRNQPNDDFFFSGLSTVTKANPRIDYHFHLPWTFLPHAPKCFLKEAARTLSWILARGVPPLLLSSVKCPPENFSISLWAIRVLHCYATRVLRLREEMGNSN